MSGEALEENEAVESENVINTNNAMSNALPENEFGIENEKHEETNDSGEEGANKGITVDNVGENTTISEMHDDDDMVDLYQMGSEDDEEDDLWEDDSDDEDDEETAVDGDEISEEEGTEGGRDEENSGADDEEIAIDKDRVSEQAVIKEDSDDEKAGVKKEISKAGKRESGKRIVMKVEANLKKVKTSNERKEKNHVAEESAKKPVVIEKPKSSKRKGKKRVESMGMIFMCSSKTKDDCFQYKVLGLPENKKDAVEQIYPGMRLFLYDVDLRLMYGIYKAHGRGGYNIEPKAFKSKFPSQVRFSILANCLPLAEEKFKKVIKENYFTNKKFDCKLNSEQVKKLCKLFQFTNKDNKQKKFPRSQKAEELQLPILGESSRNRRGMERRHPPTVKEKIQYVERPRKRLRKTISREPLPRHIRTSPRPPSGHIVVLDRNSDEVHYRRDVYVESRDRYRDPYRPDMYESRRGRPIERSDLYQEERDLHLERRDSYQRELDPYLDQHDHVLYRDERCPYLDRRAPYADPRDSYPDRRIRYTDLDPYPDTRDSRDTYIEDRDLYIQSRVYKDVPITDSYGFYRRDIISGSRDVNKEDRGVAYRDLLRVGELLNRPLSLERRRYDVVAQDPYVYRVLTSTTEHLYSAAYPSRSGLTREYRL